jgi:hypothetical protein
MHICYSIDAIGEIPARGIAATDEGGDPWVAAAFLEAFLVHARGLIEFIAGRAVKPGLPPRKKRDSRDITPDDFTTGWALADPAKYDLTLDEIDKHLAHFSKVRGTAGHAPDGLCTDLAADLLIDFTEFARAIHAKGDPSMAHVFTVAVDRAEKNLATVTRPWPAPVWG